MELLLSHLKISFAAALLLVWSCVPVRSELLAYDSFSYTNDSNYYKAGGLGWSNAWGGLTVTGGLTYTKNNRPLNSQGGGAPLVNPVERYLDTSPSGPFAPYLDANSVIGEAGTDVWISFVVQPIQLNQYYAGILFSRGSGSFGFWLTNGMQQLAPGVPLLLSTNYFIVEHIQFGADDNDLREEYFNSIPGMSSPVGAQGTNSYYGNMSFNIIGMIGNSVHSAAGSIDELRFGQSYADVAPLTPVILTNIQSTAGQMSFSFRSLTGLSHKIEKRSDITMGAWTSVTNLTGDGGLKQVTVPTTGSAVGLLRVGTE